MIDKNLDISPHIDILSTDDTKLKILSEIISNKSSIEILNLLFSNELTANEIAQKTSLSLQLTKYHLEKMQKINLVDISKVEKNSKSRDMNYYKATKIAIIITPSRLAERVKSSKLLERSFHFISKSFGLGLATALSVLSLIFVTAESTILSPIKTWYAGFQLPVQIHGTGMPSSIDEAFYLAKTKVESVALNPGGGSGTPYFDPYSNVMGFTANDFLVTMLVIAGIGLGMSLPFFVMSYRHSKRSFLHSSRI